MWKPFAFANAVRSHWGAIVTSGFLVGLLTILQETGHHVPASVYWGVALVGLVVACFRAWLSENEKLEAEKLECARLRSAPRRDWSGDWKDLADRFKPYVGSGVRADWQHSSFSGAGGWTMCGGTREALRNCESFCKLAAALLANSPGVSQKLSAAVRSEIDGLQKWLYFLKETQGLSQSGYGFEVARDNKEFLLTFGSIQDLARVSATACIECAAGTFIDSQLSGLPDETSGRK